MYPGNGCVMVVKSFPKLVWVVEGELTLRFPGEEWRLSAGMVAIIPAGLERGLECASPICETRGLSVKGRRAATMLAGFGFELPLACEAGACPVSSFVRLEEVIQDMTLAGIRAAWGSLFEVLSLIATGGAGSGVETVIAERARSEIDSNLGSVELNVNWLADRLAVDRSRLSRLFKASYGVSPIAYVIHRRVQTAMNLLSSTDWPVRRIARECGIANPDYFSRLFKREVGTRPGEFRAGDGA